MTTSAELCNKLVVRYTGGKRIPDSDVTNIMQAFGPFARGVVRNGLSPRTHCPAMRDRDRDLEARIESRRGEGGDHTPYPMAAENDTSRAWNALHGANDSEGAKLKFSMLEMRNIAHAEGQTASSSGNSASRWTITAGESSSG